MKQIISAGLAKELNIPGNSICRFFLIENGKVLTRWSSCNEPLQLIEDKEAEYIGNDRSRLVKRERERWFLWQYGNKWSLDHYPSNKTLAGHMVTDLIPILDRSTNDPNHYTELSELEAEYILAKPDSEGWELRTPVAGDSVLVARGGLIVIYSLSDAQRVNKDTINGLRWCQKPVLVPWTMEDVPPVCWLRRMGVDCHQSVVDICSDTIAVQGRVIVYDELAKNYEWSTDLKTWKSCTKEK